MLLCGHSEKTSRNRGDDGVLQVLKAKDMKHEIFTITFTINLSQSWIDKTFHNIRSICVIAKQGTCDQEEHPEHAFQTHKAFKIHTSPRIHGIVV